MLIQELPHRRLPRARRDSTMDRAAGAGDDAWADPAPRLHQLDRSAGCHPGLHSLHAQQDSSASLGRHPAAGSPRVPASRGHPRPQCLPGHHLHRVIRSRAADQARYHQTH